MKFTALGKRSKFLLNLWLAYAIVSVADLVLTGLFLDASTEANPIASWIWSTSGYLGIILYKIFIIAFLIYPSCKRVEKRNKLAAKAIILFGIFVTSVTCVLFIGVI